MPDKNPNAEPRGVDEILQMRVFQIPALAGGALVALAFVTDSAFQWVLLFFYFIFGLPGIYLYARSLPQDEPDVLATVPQQIESHQGLRKELVRCLLLSGIDARQAERALGQFDHAVQALKTLPEDASDRQFSHARAQFRAVMRNLGEVVTVLDALARMNASQILRKIQSLAGRSDLSERDRKELEVAREQAATQEQLLSALLDRLNANDSMIRAIGLPPPPRPRRKS